MTIPNISVPKKGEVARWMLWVMGIAIAGLCCYIVIREQAHDLDRKAWQEYAEKIQELRNKDQADFRREMANVYERVQSLTEKLLKKK